MDERTFTTLELEALVNRLARHVQTPLGRNRVMALVPSTDRDQINRALDLTSECVGYIASLGSFGLHDIADPEDSLTALHVEGTSLDPQQILALQRLVAAAM